MCGRFTLFADWQAIQSAFDLGETRADIAPSYNIAPTHPVLTIVQRGGLNTWQVMRWGMIPTWAKDATIGARLINARAETIAEKPSFKRALIKRRCLIIADGFYEWRKDGTRKTPMYISLKSNEPFGFAGVYDTWKSPTGETVISCAIITTEANALMASIHDRMPVILRQADQPFWLDVANEDAQKLTALLKPYPAKAMHAHAVSPLVNSPRNNSPACIQPVA